MTSAEQQASRNESAVEKHHRSSMLDDSNSNESSDSLNSRRSSSRQSVRSNSSVDIETNGSADEGSHHHSAHVEMVAALSTVGAISNPAVPAVSNMSVADSLSPVKPLVVHNPSHEASSSSTAAKLSLNHHVSHLYTIEAILGLNNQHPKGNFFINSFTIELVANWMGG